MLWGVVKELQNGIIKRANGTAAATLTENGGQTKPAGTNINSCVIEAEAGTAGGKTLL